LVALKNGKFAEDRSTALAGGPAFPVNVLM
jgi:hypothetical protein